MSPFQISLISTIVLLLMGAGGTAVILADPNRHRKERLVKKCIIFIGIIMALGITHMWLGS